MKKIMANYLTDTLDIADGKSGEVFLPFAKWYLINRSMKRSSLLLNTAYL